MYLFKVYLDYWSGVVKRYFTKCWSTDHYSAHLNLKYLYVITNKPLHQNLIFLDRNTLNNIILKYMKLKMYIIVTEKYKDKK